MSDANTSDSVVPPTAWLAGTTPEERYNFLRFIAAADDALPHVADPDRANNLAATLEWVYRSWPVAIDFCRLAGHGAPLCDFVAPPGMYKNAIDHARWQRMHDDLVEHAMNMLRAKQEQIDRLQRRLDERA